ncbi:MAG TPA: hypothetical protein VMJ10_37095 [Kofleriaceae bacterium]|nr:hypothetical protein [Kofleriaceae bacterium]
MTRLLPIVAVLAGCATTTYNIPQSELMRLAGTPPPERGQRVRVVQQLTDDNLDPVQPVTEDTELVLFPEPGVYGPDRRRYYDGGNLGNLNVPSSHGGGAAPRTSGGVHGGGGHGGGGHGGGGGGHGGGGLGSLGGGDKGTAVVLLAAAALAMFIDAGVEGSRFDGYAQLHPMYPIHLVGKDGGTAMMPLAWIDPATAVWADHGVVRTDEGPWRTLERAPLWRTGFTYSLLGGAGSYQALDGSIAMGPAASIQLGYFFDQKVGLVGNMYLGFGNGGVADSRYTLEVHGYPVQLGRVHLGLYGGGGSACETGCAVAGVGGALVELDVNTRIALTGRLGLAIDANDNTRNDVLFGLSVY